MSNNQGLTMRIQQIAHVAAQSMREALGRDESPPTDDDMEKQFQIGQILSEFEAKPQPSVGEVKTQTKQGDGRPKVETIIGGGLGDAMKRVEESERWTGL